MTTDLWVECGIADWRVEHVPELLPAWMECGELRPDGVEGGDDGLAMGEVGVPQLVCDIDEDEGASCKHEINRNRYRT